MLCRQCWEETPGRDWIELRQRHEAAMGDHGELITVEAVVLCAPPRVCLAEWSQGATERAVEANRRAVERYGSEPF